MFKKILLFFLLKYIILYALLMLLNKNDSILRIASFKNVEDWFYYGVLLLLLPITNMVLFSGVLYVALKSQSLIKLISLVSGVWVAEYFLYVFFTSQRHVDVNGVYNVIIGSLLFLLFFFKRIKVIYQYQGTEKH